MHESEVGGRATPRGEMRAGLCASPDWVGQRLPHAVSGTAANGSQRGSVGRDSSIVSCSPISRLAKLHAVFQTLPPVRCAWSPWPRCCDAPATTSSLARHSQSASHSLFSLHRPGSFLPLASIHYHLTLSCFGTPFFRSPTFTSLHATHLLYPRAGTRLGRYVHPFRLVA